MTDGAILQCHDRMARPHTILQSKFPYNIGGRCINQDWFAIPMETVWQIMSEQLHFIHGAFGVKIHSFVLMSNHFHLLMSTPRSNLSSAMEWFMRETSRDLTRAGNRINQTYGGSHYRSILGSNHYFLNAYKYNYYNPVKARICSDVLRYPYSTLAGKLGLSKMLIPVDDDLTLFSDVEGTLSWLNRPPNEKMWKAMGLALHRKEFKLSKVNGKPHPLETDAL